MALVNNNIIDLLTKTGSLTATVLGSPVETINFANNQITFAARSDISISKSDFLALIKQINVFQTTLLANFSLNVSATVPFNSVNCVETNDIPNKNWDLTCLSGVGRRLVNYTTNGPTQMTELKNRTNSETIEFPEWIYLLFSLNHYSNSINNFFGI